MRIHEVQLDNALPFVEARITLPYGTYRPTLTNGYGLIMTKLKMSYVKRNDKVKFLDVKGYIDMQQVIWHHGDPIKVIDMTPILGGGRFARHLDIPVEQYKVSGFQSELLTVEDDNIIGIFLVYDPNKNLLQHGFLPPFSTNSKKLLIEFIKNHKIDSVIIRGQQGPLNVDLMKTELGVENDEYITDNGNDMLTISKCKSFGQPFNLKNYKFGTKSPGKLNSILAIDLL